LAFLNWGGRELSRRFSGKSLAPPQSEPVFPPAVEPTMITALNRSPRDQESELSALHTRAEVLAQELEDLHRRIRELEAPARKSLPSR